MVTSGSVESRSTVNGIEVREALQRTVGLKSELDN